MAENIPVSERPGDDIPVSSGMNSPTVITAIRAYKKEAADAKKTRMRQNKANMDAYMGLQDWSHKTTGQSREFLPKTAVAVEQFVGFAKRALTQFGAWYDIDFGRDSASPISSAAARRLLDAFLDNLLVNTNREGPFATLLSDGLKTGALESLVVFKIHGHSIEERTFEVEPGQPIIDNDTQEMTQGDEELVTKITNPWRLRIDLVRSGDYFPDPTGRGLYEIHSSEHDLHYVIDRAKEGIYDESVVEEMRVDFQQKEDEARNTRDMGQDDSQPPGFRKRIVLDEFWGTLLDEDGRAVQRNVLCTVANDRWLIRKPTPNPFWHQESPFVATPLIRVPFSVWHKALMDGGVQLNLALNELFNLMLDGGLSSVWGIKQLRVDDLENPGEVSDGIPQGTTLAVKNTLPHGQKVIEKVAEGEIPTDAMAVFEMVTREFTSAALSNELKMGSLPPKQVKATEVVELSQSQAVTLDSIIADVELDLIGRTLRKSWLTVMQNLGDVASDRIIAAIGLDSAFKLATMSPAKRFATFANECRFKVYGLSAVLSKVRDFQKMMALLQAVVSNPVLLQAFFKKYSPDRVLSHLMKSLSVNPEQMARDDEELGKVMQELEELPMFQQLAGGKPGQGGGNAGAGGGGGAGLSAQNTGEPGLPAEINSAGNASSGLAGAGGA